MKILCIIDSLGSGGAQRQMTYLAKGLKERGHDVSIFIYQPGHDHFRFAIESVGIPIYEVKRNGSKGFSLFVLWKLYLRLLVGANGIISFLPTANVYAALAKLLMFNRRLVVSQRTSSAASTSTIRKWMSYFAYYCASTVTTNSQTEATVLRKALPRLVDKIHTVWNGYEIGEFDGRQSQNNGVRKLLVVGRVAYMKNGLRLLQALDLFQQRNGYLPCVQWAGRRELGAHSQKIQVEMDQFLIEHPKIADNWVWLGEVNDVDQLYRENDALIHVSLFEGLPNVICEAMIAGCLVIASDVCDHPILLGGGERGLLCDPLSPKSICEAIERLDRMVDKQRINMLIKAREFAEKNLAVDRMVQAYEVFLT